MHPNVYAVNMNIYTTHVFWYMFGIHQLHCDQLIYPLHLILIDDGYIPVFYRSFPGGR